MGLRSFITNKYFNSVCEAHLQAKHAKTRGSEDMPPENFENLDLLRYNFGAFWLSKSQTLIMMKLRVLVKPLLMLLAVFAYYVH